LIARFRKEPGSDLEVIVLNIRTFTEKEKPLHRKGGNDRTDSTSSFIRFYHMRRFLCAAAACLYLLPTLPLRGEQTLPERTLKQLVEEEQQMLRGSVRSDGTLDENLLERRYQGLVHKYDAFIHQHPGFPVGYVAYGRVLERIGQDEAAYALYLKANQLDPNIPLVKNQLGNYLVEQGEYAQALPYYLAAIELDPKEALYHYQLGSLLAHFRDDFIAQEMFTRKVLDEKMLAAFQEAARLAPAQVAFAYRFAEAFYDLHEPQWDQALREWRALERKVNPGVEQQTIWLHQANVLLQQGNAKDARELVARVTEPVLARNRQGLQEKLEQVDKTPPASEPGQN
jgi:tetratricopeptide (TPR) repeat protein